MNDKVEKVIQKAEGWLTKLVFSKRLELWENTVLDRHLGTVENPKIQLPEDK